MIFWLSGNPSCRMALGVGELDYGGSQDLVHGSVVHNHGLDRFGGTLRRVVVVPLDCMAYINGEYKWGG